MGKEEKIYSCFIGYRHPSVRIAERVSSFSTWSALLRTMWRCTRIRMMCISMKLASFQAISTMSARDRDLS